MKCTSCGGELLEGFCPSCEATRSSVDEGGAGSWPSGEGDPNESSLETTWDEAKGDRGLAVPSPQGGESGSGSETPSKVPESAPPLPVRRFEPGTVLAGRYRIVSSLGRGGMGEVYRADDFKLVETVALKFLPASVERDPSRLDALLEEARLARKVSHPNICRVHDVGETEDGLHFISMEYVDGENLSSLLRRIGRLPRSKALEIAREIVQALAAAHDAGILHRDLKPANLMIDGSGRVRITDFGLAGAIGTAAGGGTIAYMAPELFLGQRGSVQSDVYALGLVLFELFTGQRVFRARSREELLDLHQRADPTPPSQLVPEIDSELDELILRCLHKDPARRPGALSGLDRTLARLQDGFESEVSGEGEASSPSPPSLFGVDVRGRPYLLGLLAAAGIVYLAMARPWESVVGLGADDKGGRPAVSSPREAAVPAPEVRPSLAVLPLHNRTQEPESAWIGLAIAETLVTELSILGADRVIPPHRLQTALREADLEEAETYSASDLALLRRRVGADRVLVGAFSRVGDGDRGLLRLDLRLLETEAGTLLATHGATGTDDQLFYVALRVGEAMRNELAAAELSPEQSLAVRANLPEDPQAARFYVEGVAELRRLDFVAAQSLLDRSVELEPDHPMSQAALAEVWWKLGYLKRAKATVAKAVALSGVLGLRQQREILALAAKVEQRQADRVALFEELVRAHPDELDYRVGLVEAQVDHGTLDEALVALGQARQLDLPLADEAILDHTEARVHQRRESFEEQRDLSRRAAEKGEQIGATTLVAAARLREASACQRLGDLESEAVLVEQARALYETLGDTAGLARSLQHLGNSRYRQGDLEGAERLFVRALELYEEIGHEINMATVSMSLASLGYYRGNIDASIARLAESSELYRRLGNDVFLGEALNNLGGLLVGRGRLQEAFDAYREALALFTAMGSRARSALLLNNLAEILHWQGALEDSRRTSHEARALATEVGERSTLGYSNYRLAEVYRAQGDLFVARSHFREALEIFEGLKDQQAASEVRLGLALVSLEEGQLDEAETLADAAEQFFRSVEAPDFQHRAEGIRARVLLYRDLVSEARQKLESAKRELDPEGLPPVRFELELFESQLLVAEGREDEALTLLAKVVEDAEAQGYLGYELEARAATAELDSSGDSGPTRSLLEQIEERGYGGLAQRLRRLISPS